MGHSQSPYSRKACWRLQKRKQLPEPPDPTLPHPTLPRTRGAFSSMDRVHYTASSTQAHVELFKKRLPSQLLSPCTQARINDLIFVTRIQNSPAGKPLWARGKPKLARGRAQIHIGSFQGLNSRTWPLQTVSLPPRVTVKVDPYRLDTGLQRRVDLLPTMAKVEVTQQLGYRRVVKHSLACRREPSAGAETVGSNWLPRGNPNVATSQAQGPEPKARGAQPRAPAQARAPGPGQRALGPVAPGWALGPGPRGAAASGSPPGVCQGPQFPFLRASACSYIGSPLSGEPST